MAARKPATKTKAQAVKEATVHADCAPAGSRLTVTVRSDGTAVLTIGDVSIELDGTVKE